MPKELRSPLYDGTRGSTAAGLDWQRSPAGTGAAGHAPVSDVPQVAEIVSRVSREVLASAQRRVTSGELSPLPQIRPAQQPTAAGDAVQTGINRVPTVEKARQQSAIVLVTTSGNVPALHHKTPRG